MQRETVIKHASKPKHRTRAVQAMAEHICASDYTDGFCGPRDGECRHGRPSGYRDCVKTAEHCMRAMESRGVMVVWPYDKD
jgi:hypothetical protein